MDYNIEKLINEIDFEKNMHKKINNMMLTQYQIDVLTRYNIDYQRCNNMNELLYYIDDYLNDMESDELELIANEIAETNYYMNTNK